MESISAGMNGRLRNAYLRMADTVKGAVSPVGVAWKHVRDNFPTINLYSGDGSHPSYEGSYIEACTFYASVFRKSPVGATFIGTLDSTTASILQNAASLVVLDSLDQWNLRPVIEHTQADFISSASGTSVEFTNTSTKAQTYSWDFGDGTNSTDEHPIHVYATFGTYNVTLIAQSTCDIDTLIISVIVNAVGVLEYANNFDLASMGNGKFVINTDNEIQSMRLINSMGKEIDFQTPSTSMVHINLSEEPNGIYFAILVTSSGSYSLRIFN